MSHWREYQLKVNPKNISTGIHDFSKVSNIQRAVGKLGSLGISLGDSSLYKMEVGQFRKFDVKFLNGEEAVITLKCLS